MPFLSSISHYWPKVIAMALPFPAALLHPAHPGATTQGTAKSAPAHRTCRLPMFSCMSSSANTCTSRPGGAPCKRSILLQAVEQAVGSHHRGLGGVWENRGAETCLLGGAPDGRDGVAVRHQAAHHTMHSLPSHWEAAPVSVWVAPQPVQGSHGAEAMANDPAFPFYQRLVASNSWGGQARKACTNKPPCTL